LRKGGNTPQNLCFREGKIKLSEIGGKINNRRGGATKKTLHSDCITGESGRRNA